MGDIEATQVSLDVQQSSNSTDVVSTGQVNKFSGLILVPGGNYVLFQVVLEGISLLNFGVRESDGPTVVSDDVWDFVISDSFSFNLQQLVFRFCVLDWDQSESALNVIEHSVVFVGLWDWQDIHDTNWESSISSNFVVNSESSVFVHDSESDLASSQGKIESLSESVEMLPDDDGKG